MTDFTLVMPYFENPLILARHYENLRSLPKRTRQLMAAIIVDDGSTQHPAWGEECGVDLEVFKIMPPKVKWNQDAARNIGAHHAETHWLLLTDMDHILPAKTADYLAGNKFDPRYAYKFTRVSEPDMSDYKSHPNSWFLTKSLFDKVGGYDERFAGFYGTDGDIKNRIKEKTKILIFDYPLVRVPREVTPDASTTQFTRKSENDSKNIERIKTERAANPNWKTQRMSFPFAKVYPAPAEA